MLARIMEVQDWEVNQVLLDAFPAGLVVCNGDGTITHVNGELCAMLGYVQSDLVGKRIEVLIPEDERAEHVGLLAGFMRKPEKRTMGSGRDLFARRRDGSTFPVEIGLNPVKSSTGLQVIASVVDLTARQEMQNNFRSIVEAAPVGMMIVDDQGLIKQCNRLLLDTFGYQSHELLGQPMEILLPERHRKNHLGHRENYLRSPGTRAMGIDMDLTGLHQSGSEFPVEIGLNPMPGPSGMRIVATINDITERKKAELRLKQLNADLDGFTYVASHDLKSPLRGIASLVEWIEEDLGTDISEEVKNNIDRIHLRVQRMEKLVEDLLTYARSGRSQRDYTTINLKAMLDDVVQFLDPPQGFAITFEGYLDNIHSSRTPLETVLRNLISNAIKHHDRPEGEIKVTVTPQGSFCLFEIRDDGPGIPPAAHGRIFKLFQALSEKDGTRSGIGLAVCRRFVEAHGGTIEVESHGESRGTCFKFSWPRFQRSDLNE